MVADQADEDVDVVGGKAEAASDVSDDADTDLGVVAGKALADVVEECPDEEEVRAAQGRSQSGGLGRRLEKVPVDREAVEGVALWVVAHGRPLGKQPGEQAPLVEGLESGDGGRPRGEDPHQGPTQLVGPRRRRCGGAGGEDVEGGAGDGQLSFGGHGRHPKGQTRVPVDVGIGTEDDHLVGDGAVAVTGERHPRLDGMRVDAGRGLGAAGTTAAAGAPEAAGARRGPQGAAAPDVVGHPGDGATRLRDGGHQGVGIVVVECGGDLVLFLEQQAVGRPSGDPMQFDARGGEHLAGRIETGEVHLVGQGGCGPSGGPHHVDVAQAAVRLLQIGLEQERHIAVGAVALVDLFGENGKPPPGPRAPEVERPGEERVHDGGITGHQATVEQAELGPEVVGRDGQDLRRATHRVVEAHSLVPHRIPDGVGDGFDILAALVDEHHVEVATGAELAPAVPAHRHQSESPDLPVCSVVQEAR